MFGKKEQDAAFWLHILLQTEPQQINVEMDTDGYCISVVQTGFGFVCVCVCLSVQHHAWHQMCVVIL